ncbi:MAG TPA: monovalent cation/H(+) antiporter subunit G [Streptosporangiaceae bacterium]|nr:monovalent cation/H(+) antiporter subunit G [Streptosporangiaceae bacterium]
MRAIAADVFLGIGALVALISCIGILVMRDAYQKLHYVTPVSLVAPVAVGLAILIKSGWSSSSAQTWLAIGFMAIASPYLSHATLRAARVRETGDWRLTERQDPQ